MKTRRTARGLTAIIAVLPFVGCDGDRAADDTADAPSQLDAANDPSAEEVDLHAPDIEPRDVPVDVTLPDVDTAQRPVRRTLEPGAWPACPEGAPSPWDTRAQPGDRTAPGFDDVTAEWGARALFGEVVALGDLNGDGFPDLVVPGEWEEQTIGFDDQLGARNSIWLGCGDRFIEVDLEARWPEAPYLPAFSAQVADVDLDGLPDLVVGSYERVFVGFQTPDGRFEGGPVWIRSNDEYGERPADQRALLVADFNADGWPDVMVSQYGGRNPLLANNGDRTFVDVGAASPGYVDSGAGETYSATLVFGAASDDPLMYIGNHDGADWLLRLRTDFRFQKVGALADDWSTMGVDFHHLDDDGGTWFASSDTDDLHLMHWNGRGLRTLRDGAPLPGVFNLWGIAFADFDNDGLVDIAAAAGNEGMDPEFDVPEFENRLILLHGRGDTDPSSEVPTWEELGGTAGDGFEPTADESYYGLVTGDLDMDGCVDLVVTPLRRLSNRPPRKHLDVPVRVLRNRCAYGRPWRGLVVAYDPGMVAEFVFTGGDGGERVRRREVRTGASIGGRGAWEQLHVASTDDETLVRVDITCSDGRSVALGPDEVPQHRYSDARTICLPALWE